MPGKTYDTDYITHDCIVIFKLEGNKVEHAADNNRQCVSQNALTKSDQLHDRKMEYEFQTNRKNKKN